MTDLEIVAKFAEQFGFEQEGVFEKYPTMVFFIDTRKKYRVQTDKILFTTHTGEIHVFLNENKNATELSISVINTISLKDFKILKGLKHIEEISFESIEEFDYKLLHSFEKLRKLRIKNNTDESIGEFLNKTKTLNKIEVKINRPVAILPKTLLNHNFPLLVNQNGKMMDFVSPEFLFYPPYKMLTFGYNDPKFYLDNYHIIETELQKPIIDGKRKKLTDPSFALLSEYYKNYEKSEIPCAIRKLCIKNLHGIKDLFLGNISINNENKEIKDPQWIFLTGENGYGKTSVLQAIVAGLSGGKDGKTDLLNEEEEISLEWKYNTEILTNIAGNKLVSMQRFYVEHFAAYGSARLNGQEDELKWEGENSSQTYHIFNTDGKLFNIEYQLINWFGLGEKNKFYERTRTLLLELLSPYVDDIKIVEDKNGYVVKYHEAAADQEIFITMKEMASGYKSIVLTIGDMIMRLDKEMKADSLKEIAGIVLIDEIDLHLHPKWQRALVEKLTNLFPKIQFIVSTHSPIPLLGAPPERTVILTVDRTKEEGITVRRLDDKIYLDELLPNSILTSPIFGFDNIFPKNNESPVLQSPDLHSDVVFNKQLDERINDFLTSKKEEEIIKRIKARRKK